MISTMFQSATILLREGLEAMLVIAALAAYIQKAGMHHRLRELYVGSVVAVAASFLAAWLFEIFNNGVHNDLLEGVTILAAAALMLYVSGWLLLRQDPRSWQQFLRAKADEALSRQTGIAVASLAFLAVFREGAETVLFIHALAQSSGGWSAGLIAGLAVGAVILMVLFFAINVLTRRLPLRPLFIVTSGFLFLMALKFIGEAIQEFQEQQIVPYTEMRGTNWLSGVGLNPTLEAISTQLFVIGLAATTFLVLAWRMRHAPRSTRA
ncbi:MAG TPA: FTR1 family protein [Xanthobacteraceae bacterium]